MVTVDSIENQEFDNFKLKRAAFDFSGLSADEKPKPTYESTVIRNGSTFMEMDTSTLYFYDEENQEWRA